MNFLRALLASLLSLVCTLAVSGFVTLQTFNATVLDRTEVKTWMSNSGVYDNLLGTVLSSNSTVKEEVEATGTNISPDTFKLALVQTFDPTFVKQSSEKVLDGTYNWLDSKASTIDFEINTTDHKETFVQKLSALLEPQLAAMPRCTSLAQFNASNPTCLPPGSTAKQAADAMAIDASNRISIFSQPLNTQNVSEVTKTQGQSTQTPANPSQQLPEAIKTMRMWLFWLPVIAIVSGALMVLLSRLHLKAAKHLAGRLTFGLAVTLAFGLIVANVGKTLKLSDYYSGGSNAAVTNIAEPILHQAAPAMGNYLALVSGIAGAITFALWIVLRVIYKRRERDQLLKPAETEPVMPTPSKAVGPTTPQPAAQPATPPKDEQK